MPEATELECLLEKIAADGMIVRSVLVPVHDVVFFKSVLEAYPGLAAVHAERGMKYGPALSDGSGPKGSAEPSAELVVATTSELSGELDAVLDELSHALALSVV